MPTYHALNTAIKLAVWEPKSKSPLKLETDQCDSTPSLSSSGANGKHNGSAKPETQRRMADFGPAAGYIVDELKEEYFEGLGGVDFIAPGMPFYLVKVGRELFTTEQSPEEKIGGPSRDFKDTTLRTPLSRISADEIDRLASSSQDGENDSRLSSISTSFFSTAGESYTAEKQKHTSEEADMRRIISSHESLKIPHKSLDEAVAKPITTPTPLTIRVDLSRKSFIPSLVDDLKQELCITIFYNGELTHSRIIRPNTFGGGRSPVDDEKYQYYSGRRIDTIIECPWIVLPNPQSEEGTIATGELGNFEFAERWNKINQMLLAEADEWGRYDRWRSPMGEYLEALSMRPVPKNTKSEGLRAGIVDVVITLGRAAGASVTGLREPRRKLHEDFCGLRKQWVVAPAELRPAKKAKTITNFNLETSQDVARSKNSSNAPAFGEKSPRAAHTLLNGSGIQDGSSCEANYQSEGTLAESKQPLMDGNEGPSIATSTNPNDEPEPSPKRQKRRNSLKFLPLDSEEPASASSRSRRAAIQPSISSIRTLESNHPQQLSEGDWGLRKTKNAPGQFTGTPVTSVRLMGVSEVGSEEEGARCSSQDQGNGKSPFNSVVVSGSSEAQPGTHDRDQSQSLTKSNCGVSPLPQTLGSQQSYLQTTGAIPIPPIDFQASGVEPRFVEDQEENSQSLPPQNNSLARNRIQFSRYEGSEREYRPEYKPRSSTGSICLRSSISKNDQGLSTQTSSPSDGQLPHQSSSTMSFTPRKVTRIVFKADDRTSSTFVNCESLQALRIPVCDSKAAINLGVEKHTINGRDKNAAQKETESARKVLNESITQNGPSPIDKRRNNKASAITSNVVAPNKAVSINRPSSKKQNTLKGFVQPVKSDREQSTAPTSLVASENTKMTLHTQSRPKRDTVSSRELKNLSSPHKPFTVVDPSFSSALRGTHKGTRSSRNSMDNYAPPAMSAAAETSNLIVNNMKISSNEVTAMSASTKDGRTMTFRTNPIDEATSGEVSKEPPELSTTAGNTRSKTKLSDAHIRPLGPTRFRETPTNSKYVPADATSIPNTATDSSPDLVNAKLSDIRDSEEISKHISQSGNQMIGTFSQAILSSKQPRSHAVGSEGRKIPTQREHPNSVPTSIESSRSQKQIAPSTPKLPLWAATLPREIKPSVSQVAPQSPEIRITRKRKASIALVPEQSGGSSTTLSATNVKAPETPQVPIFQTLKLPASNATITTTTLPPAKTPDSRSRSKAKRKTIELASPSEPQTIVPPSRQWKPNHMCDESVLTYASGEAWPGVSIDEVSGHVVRNIRMEREGVFRASGVLMGVRFVVGLL